MSGLGALAKPGKENIGLVKWTETALLMPAVKGLAARSKRFWGRQLATRWMRLARSWTKPSRRPCLGKRSLLA